MARYETTPGGRAEGQITVPGDKSISHRALMLGGIATGTTDITGFLAGEDCLATLRALEQLGVRIERPQDQHVIVHGVGAGGLRGTSTPLDMGNAGTAMRLFMGLLAPQAFTSTLIGDESLMKRPMERVAKPLRLMGASIETQEGRPPVRIQAGAALRGIDYALPVASAQVKSAILLAGLRASGRTSVIEPAPARDHTERMLRAFGVKVQQNGSTVALEGGQALRGTSVQVPADFSSAAFFLVAGCLAAERPLILRNVGVNPTRTGLLQLLLQMGADIRVHQRRVGAIGKSGAGGGPGAGDAGSSSDARAAVEAVGAGGARPADDAGGEGDDTEPVADIEVRRSRLHGINVPEALVPLSIDEFPVFFIAAACAEGETLVRGAAELRVKESDRLATMAAGLSVVGIDNRLYPDGLWIKGGELGGGIVDSHGDHRIAMAFAVASLRARAPISILDVANVATSFPGFLETARTAGLQIELA